MLSFYRFFFLRKILNTTLPARMNVKYWSCEHRLHTRRSTNCISGRTDWMLMLSLLPNNNITVYKSLRLNLCVCLFSQIVSSQRRAGEWQWAKLISALFVWTISGLISYIVRTHTTAPRCFSTDKELLLWTFSSFIVTQFNAKIPQG